MNGTFAIIGLVKCLDFSPISASSDEVRRVSSGWDIPR